MKQILFSFLLVFISYLNAFSQHCNCEENFKWVKKTFEENDAGFNYALSIKGEAAYKKHNDFYESKVKEITDLDKCADVIYDWLTFFRKGHFYINIIQDSNEVTEKAIINTDNWEKYPISEEEFNKYLSKGKHEPLEGIWKTDPYTIGVIKTKSGYTGFILDGGNTSWQKYEVKFKLNVTEPNSYGGTYYLRDYSEYKLNNIIQIGENTLQIDNIFLYRVNPKLEDTKQIKSYLELIKANRPLMQQYSDSTLVLRIPSFSNGYKREIDSVIAANHDKIISTPNLIIDIRNNGGGSDGSYSEIIPYLYTNPIRIVGMELLSTTLNNKRMESYLDDPDITKKDKKEVQKSLKILNDNLGKFVNLGDKKVYIQELNTVYSYPKNVGILINKGNGSTSEQFLLAAKQSSKTKLFGATTAGVLDISNMYYAISPSGDLKLGYCLSKSYRIPDMAIDGKGILPDYYLDSEIPQSEWVQYAQDSFSKNK
ncbi:S41 family peptidase [Flavobacterium rakeshii]|uniref:S41 family peptidase n=1 Tax=Flavobacterium rakeshii TaxID=1038845 RepID=UPI002E7BA630|nr:S41 family peptidase [Flavobacterium rakeshii]MEE1898263.1 S41 family peptidase [Flavobacterium rakeshii]